MAASDTAALLAIRTAARPLKTDAALAALAARIAPARTVLIGEASHGTHDFYALRADLTRRLIVDHGFMAVALEADWPDTFRAHRFVSSRSDDRDAVAALSDFQRFPAWMWRNEVMAGFVGWLREVNRARRPAQQVGLYGLDLYSLHASIEAVLRYLDQVDPAAAQRARARYACFEHYGDPQHYGLAASAGAETCEGAVVEQLVDLRRRAGELSRIDGYPAREELFSAEQNARLIRNAEQYYRSMFRGRDESWNLRDRHMAETLEALRERLGASAGIVVWAHNSHLGDARATEMGRRGELNLGQLVRERAGEACCAVGLSTYTGTVTAASDWDAPAERKRVRPGLPGSYETLLHGAAHERFWLDLHEADLARALADERLQRAIGVIYRPQTERWSHYFGARLPQQFDVFVHLDQTAALRPLEIDSGWSEGEPPETYPSAL
ncbi:MAG TPA: erythromycin esterase family protein [Casimicrobiaceae bacterium]|nr:erythromycin esterase family protein [Casimicrobiaceae bacterium]